MKQSLLEWQTCKKSKHFPYYENEPDFKDDQHVTAIRINNMQQFYANSHVKTEALHS